MKVYGKKQEMLWWKSKSWRLGSHKILTHRYAGTIAGQGGQSDKDTCPSRYRNAASFIRPELSKFLNDLAGLTLFSLSSGGNSVNHTIFKTCYL